MRLFVAIWPPDEVIEHLRCLPRKDRRGVRFVPEHNWHVTLRFLGDADPALAEQALNSTELPVARVRLGPGVDLLGDRSLVLPADGVDELAACVAAATDGIGQPSPQRFIGHLTIARLKPGVELPPAMGAYLSAAWQVDEVSLVQSQLHPDGARYTVLASFPTAAGDR